MSIICSYGDEMGHVVNMIGFVVVVQYYDRLFQTSIFTPAYGSVTHVWVTSLVNTTEVVNMLLDKFKVENSPRDFALFIVRDNGGWTHLPIYLSSR